MKTLRKFNLSLPILQFVCNSLDIAPLWIAHMFELFLFECMTWNIMLKCRLAGFRLKRPSLLRILHRQAEPLLTSMDTILLNFSKGRLTAYALYTNAMNPTSWKPDRWNEKCDYCECFRVVKLGPYMRQENVSSSSRLHSFVVVPSRQVEQSLFEKTACHNLYSCWCGRAGVQIYFQLEWLLSLWRTYTNKLHY